MVICEKQFTFCVQLSCFLFFPDLPLFFFFFIFEFPYFQLFTDIKNHLLGTIYYMEVLLIMSRKIHRKLEGYFSFLQQLSSTSQPCLPIPLPN